MIKFVYFDLGGVVELDFSKTDKWSEFKKEIGITSITDVEFEKFWEKFEYQVCIGQDIESLIPILKENFGIGLSEGYSVLIDGFVNRFEINKTIWPAIEEIRKSCRIGLLTNMYPGMFQAIKKRGIIPDVDWEVIIDSSVEGVAKPDPAIFKLAEERAGEKGDQILFVENSPGNIATAQKFAWETFLYDPAHPDNSSHDLLTFFRSLSLLTWVACRKFSFWEQREKLRGRVFC